METAANELGYILANGLVLALPIAGFVLSIVWRDRIGRTAAALAMGGCGALAANAALGILWFLALTSGALRIDGWPQLLTVTGLLRTGLHLAGVALLVAAVLARRPGVPATASGYVGPGHFPMEDGGLDHPGPDHPGPGRGPGATPG